MRIKLRTSCLMQTSITISPTQQLLLGGRFLCEVTYEGHYYSCVGTRKYTNWYEKIDISTGWCYQPVLP